MIRQYVKKPVQISALEFTGSNTLEIESFIGHPIEWLTSSPPIGKIPTLEGIMDLRKGDFLIRGIKGEFYPCKPDIFIATYTEVLP